VGGMMIAVDIGSGGQDVERVPAVIASDGRELPSAQHLVAPGSFQNAGYHDLVALIKTGKAAFEAQVQFVERSKVAVEVGGGVVGLAEGVVAQHADVVREALVHLH